MFDKKGQRSPAFLSAKTSHNTATWAHRNHQSLQANHETREQHATAPLKYECNERPNSSNIPVRTHRPPKYYARKPSWMPYYLWQCTLIEQQWASEHMYDQWETAKPQSMHTPHESHERLPRTQPRKQSRACPTMFVIAIP